MYAPRLTPNAVLDARSNRIAIISGISDQRVDRSADWSGAGGHLPLVSRDH